ncbi:MAG TPA: HypC/HybG/HupF family hydrogenase formation chaperone [Candidatus Acidoferrales bacterium]|nr:HypC/HybG/HupF family hydrogenase formation chaperone [Candidatus Acidoferrales bacterium]
MCLGVPGRIVRLVEEEGLQMGDVDFGGAVRRVCLAYVPDAAEGDYAVIHAGFAISLLDAAEAERTLSLLNDAFGEDLLALNPSPDTENS